MTSYATALLVVACLCTLVVRTAWISDDAFISMRTVRNFVQGDGLVWNLDERVQVFTHPLWMFVVSGAYALTREAQAALYSASFLATFGFLAVVWWSAGRWRTEERTPARSSRAGGLVLALAMLTTSKAFVEYSTSGLENPLTHLLVAGVYTAYLEGGRRGERATALVLLASLAALNRLDSALLVAPPVAATLLRLWREHGPAPVVRAGALGSAPLLAWEAFSFVYYGAWVPNTALAKLGTGLPRG